MGEELGCVSESGATSTSGGGRSPEHEEHEEQLECRAILIARSCCERLGISCEAGYSTFIVVGEAQRHRASASEPQTRTSNTLLSQIRSLAVETSVTSAVCTERQPPARYSSCHGRNDGTFRCPSQTIRAQSSATCAQTPRMHGLAASA